MSGYQGPKVHLPEEGGGSVDLDRGGSSEAFGGEFLSISIGHIRGGVLGTPVD